MSTRSFTIRAYVLARKPAPNLMLGMLERATEGSEGPLNWKRGWEGGGGTRKCVAVV